MLVLAQVGLYTWAIYAIGWGVVRGQFPGWEVLAGFARVLGAYGIANEGRLGQGIAVLVSAVSALPALHEAVTEPRLLLHPEFVLLLVFPIAILLFLYEPSARDYQREWFR